MSERNMKIVYSSSLDALTEHNASFDIGVLRVCYVGQNRNNSFISKQTFERCIKSIYNCPIVCNYDRVSDEIGAHDMEVVKDSVGSVRLVNVTQPVGLVPESANYWWEEVEEDDGVIHEYLCVDALLWRRQEAYQKIKADGITDESMEISIQEGAMRDGIFVIERFEFTAFCLLGTAEPCYESASLMTFSQEDIKAQLSEMLTDLKKEVCAAKEAGTDPGSDPKGGDETLDEKMTLMAQYGLTEDMLDFSLNEFSEDELREKFEAIKARGGGSQEGGEFALAEQFREELMGALSTEKVDTCFGEMSRYWYVDYDAEAAEVYCYDQEDWKLYGFLYSMNGDHVTVNFESKKRKKCAIVDFDEGEQNAAFAAVYSAVQNQYAQVKAEWEKKYQDASDKAAAMENELCRLRKFKAEAEQTAADQARGEVLAQFADLSGIEAFEDIRENCSQYSPEDLEEKCYAIRGRNQTGKFALQGQSRIPKLPIDKRADTSDEPYGGIFDEYGIR